MLVAVGRALLASSTLHQSTLAQPQGLAALAILDSIVPVVSAPTPIEPWPSRQCRPAHRSTLACVASPSWSTRNRALSARPKRRMHQTRIDMLHAFLIVATSSIDKDLRDAMSRLVASGKDPVMRIVRLAPPRRLVCAVSIDPTGNTSLPTYRSDMVVLVVNLLRSLAGDSFLAAA